MYLLIKTPGEIAYLALRSPDGETVAVDEWPAGRALAKDLLRHIDRLIHEHGYDWQRLQGIGVFEGPGSFTSLRIGLTVANAVAYAEQISIVGVTDDDWAGEAGRRLSRGDDDRQVLPVYGADPRITLPRK